MINMAQKQHIILGYHREGKTQREIAQELSISRTTVFNVLKKYEQTRDKDKQIIPCEGIIEPPGYNSSKRRKRSLTAEIQAKIDEYLSKNELKKQIGRGKQQLRAVDIHAFLEEQGYQIGYTTVCTYIRKEKQKPREVFIRQSYAAGQAVEFDWAEVRLTLKGKDKRLMLAVFTSCYSNHRRAMLFHRQDMSSFLYAHACYFSFIGYVAAQLVYDNMRVAVAKFAVKNKDKQPTEDLLKLSIYYQFDYRFCNVRKGNEKGFVERSVEYIRRKSFALIDEFDSLEQANQHLFQTLDKLNEKPSKGQTESIQSRFEQEKAVMQPAAPPYDVGIIRRLRIDKYSCIKVDTNYYSVPEDYPDKIVEVKIYPAFIRIYADNLVLTQHQRRHSRFQYYLHLEHFLKTLLTKPGALAGSKSLQQADKDLRQVFQRYFKDQASIFIELLLFIKQNQIPIHQFIMALRQCLKICPHQNPCSDKIKVFLLNQPTVKIQYGHSDLSSQIRSQAQQQLIDIQALLKPEDG